MTFWRVEWRKSRKTYQCVACFRVIDTGERYQNGAGMDGSAAWTWHTCQHCALSLEFWYDHIVVDEEWGFGDFEIWATEYPAQSLPELRAQVSWRKRWRYNSGPLMPLPTEPPKGTV